MNSGGRATTRRDLLHLLSQAAELEHSLTCQYLFTAFSLKQDTDPGPSDAQQEKIQRWRKQIIDIAVQEMLHLALASNLLTAIGGAPYLRRANFPQAKTYTSLGLRFVLTPFNEETIRRYICFELPEDFEPKEGEEDWNQRCAEVKAGLLMMALAEPLLPKKLEYNTIGELYQLIRSGFEDVEQVLQAKGKTLFIGPPTAQATGIWPELTSITDVASAHKAIDLIIEQGEGTPTDQAENHFRWFIKVLEEYLAELNADPTFQPAWPVIENPLLDLQHTHTLPTQPEEDPQIPHANVITEPLSHDVMEIFGALYEVMLQILSRFFAHSGEDDEQLYILKSAFLNLMEYALSPLGTAITRLPAGPQYPGKNAGPSFEVFSDVQLLPQMHSAWTYFQERLDEISEACAALAADPSTQPHIDLRNRLNAVSANLKKIAFTFSVGLAPPETWTWKNGISQLFSPMDVDHMLNKAPIRLDLANFNIVKADVESPLGTILEVLDTRFMPMLPLGAWTAKRFERFQEWVDQGCQFE